MRLIIGGAAQGKLEYALRTYPAAAPQIAEQPQDAETAHIWHHLEAYIRNALREGIEPKEQIRAVIQKNPDIIIICDEVGCGVVPMVPEERAWREAVGRSCCELAEIATSVERIFCGVPLKLKGK